VPIQNRARITRKAADLATREPLTCLLELTVSWNACGLTRLGHCGHGRRLPTYGRSTLGTDLYTTGTREAT
jgi:hypothetical protein